MEKDPKRKRSDTEQTTIISMDADGDDVTEDGVNNLQTQPQDGAATSDGSNRPIGPVILPQTDPVRILPEIVPSFRIIRKQVKALTRARYNHDTLDSAIKEHRLPKGLSPTKIPLKIPDVSTEIQLDWEKAHIDLNKTLTELLRKHWANRIMKLNEEHDNTLDHIRKNSDPGVLNHILRLLNQYKTETLAELDERMKKKMASNARMAKKKEGNKNENTGQEPNSEPLEP